MKMQTKECIRLWDRKREKVREREREKPSALSPGEEGERAEAAGRWVAGATRRPLGSWSGGV